MECSNGCDETAMYCAKCLHKAKTSIQQLKDEMIDISKLKTYSKPHKVYIPSKYGVFVKRADLEQLLKNNQERN